MPQETDWESLYRQTRHRIGNTMQMLISLLRLQMRTEGPDARQALGRLDMRLAAVAAAYSLTRLSTDQAPRQLVDFAAYTAEMVEETRRQIAPVPDVAINLAPADIPLDHAISVGVAVTEILANAVRHGGPPLSVSLEAVADQGLWRIIVRDGGGGVPPAATQHDGLGLRIAESLMRQVKGRLVLDEGPVRLEWPVE